MLTQPMQHQKKGRKLLRANPVYYSLACEQGTGKTWMLLDDIEYQMENDLIDAALVVAPKGVHTNWIRREIPKHVGEDWTTGYWVPEKTKKAVRLQNLMLSTKNKAVFAMNIDALNTERGYSFAAKFLKSRRCMFIIDESTRIKSPTAGRSKKAVKLGTLSVSRRTASGMNMPNGPQDVFMQYEFLAPKLGLLGTTSYRAFVATYSELLPEHTPLYQEILKKTRGKQRPQIVQKDAAGRPKYKNLDRLSKLMAPYTYRVTKDECLDLPKKIYQTYGFDLPTSQQRVYDFVEEDMRIELDGQLHVFDKLTVKTKLRQIVSCFMMVDGEPTVLLEKNPRLDLLKEIISDHEGKKIIWATFRAEIESIANLLKKEGIKYVEYHGGVNKNDRESAIDRFQEGDAEVFLGNPQAAGIGLTLTAAKTVIYYSNNYNLEDRAQSEDRAHRIGTKWNVLYIDLVANGTIDEIVAEALQSKEEVASYVMGRL